MSLYEGRWIWNDVGKETYSGYQSIQFIQITNQVL